MSPHTSKTRKKQKEQTPEERYTSLFNGEAKHLHNTYCLYFDYFQCHTDASTVSAYHSLFLPSGMIEYNTMYICRWKNLKKVFKKLISDHCCVLPSINKVDYCYYYYYYYYYYYCYCYCYLMFNR